MKTTYRIAKLEWYTLFYSPIAWLVLIIFSFQSGLSFTDKMKNFAFMLEGGSSMRFMTTALFTGPMGFLAEIQRNVYLYIPLLTMGLMSRETSSGSIRLLYSSPVKIHQIIWGKFLAMMAYCLLLVLILGTFVLAAGYSIVHFDWNLALSGLIGIYLLICAYSAIGLFMSCLTSYQVVAAISTLAVLAGLSYVGSLWQDINFVRDLTYFLSISGRADEFRDGLITSKDALYFLLVILLFLGLSMLLLRSGRESKPVWLKALRYTVLSASILLLGYLSSRPQWIWYKDMTATQARTLTPVSQALISQLKEPLKVTTYTNLLDDFWYLGQPASRNKDIAFWSPYQRFMPGMKLNYVYYYDTSMADWMYKYYKGAPIDTLARKMAKARELDLKLFLPPAQMRSVIDLAPEEYRFVRCLEYQGKRAFIREFAGEMDPNPGETEVMAAVKRLLVKPPLVAFLTGDNERATDKSGDKDYKLSTTELTFRHALVNQGFDVLTLNAGTKIWPAGISILVIADPRKAIPPDGMEKLKDYIRQGGNLLIAGEPGRQALLNPLLKELGVQLTDGELLQESRDFAPELVLGYFTAPAAAADPAMAQLWKDSAKISLRGAAGLTWQPDGPFRVLSLLCTDSSKTWNKAGRLDQDTGYVRFDPASGDRKQSHAVALALSRPLNASGKDQKIVVVGDADFMTAQELNRYNIRVANFAFMSTVFRWLNDNEFPINGSRPPSQDRKMRIGKEGVVRMKWIFLAGLPALLLLAGITLLVRRRRK